MFYRNIGVAKFVAAPYFKDIWGKLLVRYGYASFSDVLTAVCGADGNGVPEGWEMINKQLGKGRIIGRVDPAVTQDITPFALLVIEGMTRLNRTL